MASISFKYLQDKLILCYTPVIGLDDITKRLDTEDGVPIKHTFWVTKHLLCNDVEEDNDGEETLHFHIGTVGEVYTQLDSKFLVQIILSILALDSASNVEWTGEIAQLKRRNKDNQYEEYCFAVIYFIEHYLAI